jgi:hypothetical protein
MATNQYMTGRRKYARPQAILFSENPGTFENGFYMPSGYEIGTDATNISDTSLLNQFMILSDDNRNSLDFKTIRIEKRERMINGRMRSYHIADKLSLDISWSSLPSRAYSRPADFNKTTGKSPNILHGAVNGPDTKHTSDGGAGGTDLLKWYEDHKGSFWVFLAYDKKNDFGSDSASYEQLPKYNEVIEMFITDFSYSVQSRGTHQDLWEVSISLEEA